MHMAPEQEVAFERLKDLVQHSPIDVGIGVFAVAVVFGLIALIVARQKAPSSEHRQKWQLDEPRRDLWSKYFRGRWWVP
jgi:hypothetical protein